MIDHRLAFLALSALLIAAAIPLAFAWARLLPEEPPPFPIEPGSFPSIDHDPQKAAATPKRDIIAIALLVCITLAYLIRFPGFPNAVFIRWLDNSVSGPTEYWILFSARIFLIVATVAAAAYAAFRPNPLRIPLVAAAALVLILWFLSPFLRAALLFGS